MARRRRRRRRGSPSSTFVAHSLGKLKGRNHKPLKLLKSFHAKMVKNVDKLGDLIHRRQAAGER